MTYADQYLDEVEQILKALDRQAVEDMAKEIGELRARGGRIFFLGVGGGAGNASHAVNDFRKIAGIESYAPTDNVSELTARINDEGWETCLSEWLKGSNLNSNDGVFVFSVGGGHVEKRVSLGLVSALDFARKTGAAILGVVGRDGGYTAQVADECVVISVPNPETVTAHTESVHLVIEHLLMDLLKRQLAEVEVR